VVYPIKYEKPEKTAAELKRDFNRFFGVVVRSAFESLKDNVVPSSEAHFLLKDGKTVLVGELSDYKRYWRSAVRKAVKSEKPLAYVIVTPVWLAPPTKGVSPRAHPFRKNAVMITAYSPFLQKAANIFYEFITPKLIEVKKPEVWYEFEDTLVGNVFEREKK